MKTYSKSDGLDSVDLLQAAQDHFHAAEYLFEKSPSFFDSAGYLMHMAAEQILKAKLLHENGRYKGTHQLRELYSSLQGVEVELSERLSATLDLLDSYDYLRYPNRNQPIEVGSEDLPEIRKLLLHMVDLLPTELKVAASQIDPLVKGGRFLAKKKIIQEGETEVQDASDGAVDGAT